MTMTMPAGCVDGQLAGRYRLDERIAVGGMGEVWRGQDTVLGRLVAVKCLKPEYVDDAEFRERFRGEARHAAALSHPGIASVYDYGEQVEPETAAWLVMELVDGEPLSALLRREGRLTPDRTLDIVGQAAMGLEAAHEIGVVHRDVKPGNLLVRPDGVVKITDFGIARAADAVPITRTGSLVGTAYYLSPEQASGGDVTPASDVYSLAVVAYECLAGERPFPGTNPMAVATAHVRDQPPPLPADIPESVRELVMRAMEKDPTKRPVHAGDLGRAALRLRASLLDTAAMPTVPAATRVLPVVPAAEESAAPLPRARVHDHRRAVRIASVLLAVVLLGLTARACLAPADVAVPTIAAGATVDAAEQELAAAHLDAARVTETSKTIPAGHVIGTMPAAGETVHEGDDITLIVSSGKPKVTVSSASYTGKTPEAVRTALQGLGLAPTFTYDGSGAPAGTVSSVTPAGSLTYGAAVTIHVVPVPRPAPRKHGKGEDKKGD
jgi:beta-lactam-binding protein with PASTA domain/tRNA A-37 threonylcarbamoyl transferase component Bud32